MIIIEECEDCGCVFNIHDPDSNNTVDTTVIVKLTTDGGQKCEVRYPLRWGHYHCKGCIEDRENEIIRCLCDGKFVIDLN